MSGIRIEDGVPWIGDRAFPWAEGVDVNDHEMPTLGSAHHERRFRLRFENGWLLSVVFGTGTYSDNHQAGWGNGVEFSEESATAEIAAWWGEGGMIDWPDGDTVKGWVTTDELLAIIEDFSTRPSMNQAANRG